MTFVRAEEIGLMIFRLILGVDSLRRVESVHCKGYHPGPLPPRVDLQTGTVRTLDRATFKGRGGKVPGGAATVLDLPLRADKDLRSLTVRTLANEVVIGVMAATLAR